MSGLGVHVLRLMRLVVGLHGRIIRRSTRELVRRQHEIADLALLILELAHARELRGSQEIRSANSILELPSPQVAAELVLEGADREARTRQRVLCGGRRVFPLDLESRLTLDRGEHLAVADTVAQIVGVAVEERRADHALEDLILEPRP